MSRIERNRSVEKSSCFIGSQGILGILGLGILAEVLVKIPRSMTHSLPSLLDSNIVDEERKPDFDNQTNVVKVKNGSMVGIHIGNLNFAIEDVVVTKKPKAKIRINCEFVKPGDGTLVPKGGFSVWISDSSLIVNGVEFIHKA